MDDSPGAKDLYQQVSEYFENAIIDVPVRVTDTGEFSFDLSNLSEREILAAYGTLLGALMDITRALAGEIDSLRHQSDPPA